MKKAIAALALVFIFLVPIISGPAPEERFPFSERASSNGDNFVPGDWQDANSGYGDPLLGNLNGLRVSSGTSVIDFTHSGYIGVDSPLGWSSEQLEGELEHLSMWVDAELVNPSLDTYHSERWLYIGDGSSFLVPDGWTFVKNDTPSGTPHPNHGDFELNSYSGNGYDGTQGWRLDGNFGGGETLGPSNGIYMSQQVPAFWRKVYSAEITFFYYVSSTSTLDDSVHIFTRLEGYVSEHHVFNSDTSMDTWIKTSATVPSSFFESLEISESLLFDIGIGTNIDGSASAGVHEVYIDEIQLRLLVRPFPEEVDLRANGALVTGSTWGSVSPYVVDGPSSLPSGRDCYSAPDSNGGAGGVDLDGYSDGGWLDVGADSLSDWNSAFSYQVGLQFPLNIPQGSAITSAILEIETLSSSVGNPAVRIYVADEDNVPIFTSGMQGNTLLPDLFDWVNTSVYWYQSIPGANRYDTPDLSALIQSVVARPGWKSGNYICIMIDFAYAASVNSYLQIIGSAYGNQADLAQLFVDFIAPDPSDVIPSFRYNKNLVIDHTKVASDLQDFPVLVDIWDADLHLDVQPDGDDIAFLYNGEVLDHEIELFDKAGNGTHAHLVAWVKVPHISSITDTTIVMVYGDNEIGSEQNAIGVWDQDYAAVWHLNDNPASTWSSTYADYLPHLPISPGYNAPRPRIMDSVIPKTTHTTSFTSTTHGYTSGSMTPTDLVSGMIGGAIDLDGIDVVDVGDYIDFGNPSGLQMTGAFTVEAWFKADFIGNDYLIVKSDGAGNYGWDISFDDDPTISPAGWVMFRYSTDGSSMPSVGYERVEAGQWYHVAAVFSPSTALRFYLNGKLVGDVTSGVPASVYDPNVNVRIGYRGSGDTNYLDSIVDEIRISKVARSESWIKTQYNNQRNPELFLTVGDESVNFRYMKDITIDHNKVASDLTGFPLLIDIYDSDLRTNVQLDGDDIMFTSNGRSLPHEIELFDQQYNSTHAHLVSWVRADLSSISDTVITMYYSNPAMGSQENPLEVWRNQYQGVWHLGNDPSSVLPAPQITDSTENGNDGTTFGSMTQSDQVIGHIGNALDFDGSNDYVDCGNTIPLTMGYNDFAMSVWFASTDLDVPLAMKGAIGTDAYRYMLSITSSGTVKAEIDDNSVTPGKITIYSASALNDGFWHYAVLVRSGSWLHLYIDGSEVPTSPVDITGYGSINSVEPFLIAACDNYDNAGAPNLFAAAQIDEVRVLHNPITAQWILTEYNNQYDSSSFYSLGIKQEVATPKEVPLDFMYKKDITIDHSKVISDLYGFPVLIDLYDTDLRFDAQADGDDIVFVKDGWILPHEIELFEQFYNSSHAHLIAWVRMDLSSTTDMVFSMYYGNPNSNSFENPEGVWDTSFAAVWHLSEDPAGTVYDSTGNGNDGIGLPIGSEPTLQQGKIYDCAEFYGEATNDRIEAPHSDSLVLPSNMLVEAWVRTTNIDTTSDVIVAKWGAVDHRNYWLGKLDASTLAFYVDNTQSVTASFSLVNDGYWHHVAGVADSDAGQLLLYVDGIERGNAPYSGSTQTGTSVIQIGNNPGSTGFIQEWDGRIDEVRVSSSYRSPEWILTAYNNQNDPESFYKVTGEALSTAEYQFSRRVTIAAGASTVPAGYSVPITLNHAALVAAGKSQPDGDDLRIMYWDGTTMMELDRVLDSDSSWSSASSKIWFKIQSDIPAGTSDDSYFLYYGNPSTSSPPNDHANVFQFYDGFESGDLSAWNGSYTDIGDSLSVTTERSNTGYYSAKGEVDTQAAAQAMVWKDFSDKTSLFARVHFYIPLTFSTTDHVTIMQFVDTSAGWANQLSLTIRDDMTLYLWNAIAGEAYGYGTTSTLSKGSWHMLELQAKFSTTTGEARLWLDGNLEVEETGKNTGAEGVDKFCTVFYWASPQTEPNIVYADDVFLRPYVSPEPTTSFGVEFDQSIGFSFKKDITIDQSKVGTDLNDFPLLIDIFDADLRTKVQSDGDDIIFKSGEILLPYEIEDFDQSYNVSHAHLVAWVKTDLQSATDTVITMYYGNPGIGTYEDTIGVWDSTYKGVWHLRETPTGTFYDSTSNSNDGTGYNLQSDDQVDGQIDGSIDFDNTQDYINCGNDTSLKVGSSDFSLSLWFKYDGVSTGVLAGKGAVLMARRYRLSIESGPGMLLAAIDDNTVAKNIYSTSTYGDNLWHHISMVRDGNNLRLYIDGEEDPNSPLDITGYGSLDEIESFYINAFRSEVGGTLGYWSSANTDEVRVARLALTPDWIATEYSNQYDAKSFYTIGAEIQVQTIDFDYKKDIVIDHTKVDADLTGFPLLINIFDSDLKTKTQLDGDDIIFESGGVMLPHEIDLFDPYYNSTHAQLVAWVKADLSSITDTVVTMYYGNEEVTNQEDPAGVWDDNYIGVWHLGDATGGSNAIKDSTSQANHGTDFGSPIFGESGMIGDAIGFNDGPYIQIQDSLSLDSITTGITISVWTKADPYVWETPVIVKGGEDSGAFSLFYWRSSDTNDLCYYLDGVSGGTQHTGEAVTRNDWMHVVLTYDGSYVRVYKDGTLASTQVIPSTPSIISNNEPLYFGYESDYSDYFLGVIDEARISTSAQSLEWISTEYNNQYNPTNFYTVGDETVLKFENLYNIQETDFRFKKELVVDHTKVSDDLTDFPMLIDIFDMDLRTDVQADGDDIMFKRGYIWCPHEIEIFDQTYNSTHAHLVAWVKTDLSSSVDTTITMYYGNSIMTSRESPTGVWDDYYLMVQHLNDLSGTQYDSTSNNIDGVSFNYNGDESVSGKIDGAYNFDGINDAINLSITHPQRYSDFTLSSWYKSTDTSLTDDQYIWNHLEGYTATGIVLGVTDDTGEVGYLRLSIYDEYSNFYPYYGTSNIVDQQFHFVVVVRENGRIRIYVDGMLQTDTVDLNAGETITVDASEGPFIGDLPGDTEQVKGVLDEVRVSTVGRSLGWILTEYNNQYNPSSFYSIGSEEETGGKGYLFTTNSESSITIGAKLSLGVQTPIYSYADDFSLGTSFSITNGSLPIWTAGVLVSPPSELDAVSFEINYPEGEWWPFSVKTPSGTEKTFATDWTCYNGKLIVGSTAIDEYGMWKIQFLDRNHVFDMQMGPSGGPYSPTDEFTIGEDVQFRIWGSGTLGSTISLELSDSTGSTWYTGSTAFQGQRFTLPYYHRKYLSIVHDNVAEDLVNFPVLVDIYDTDLRTDVRADGRDIAFTIGERTLSHEIELFDQTYNLTHAHLIAWVNVPLLSGSTDTMISMYYGNPLAPIVYDSGPVWDSGYLGVWHLSESGTGAPDEYLDSSQYKNHGQGGEGNSSFVPTQTAGKIGSGQDFNNLDGYYDLIDCGDSPLWNIDGYQITLEAWVQHDITPNTHVYGIMNHKGWYDGYSLFVNYGGGSTLKPTFSLPGQTHQLRGANDVTGGVWHHIVATYDGSLMRIYIDGVQDPNVLPKTDAILPSAYEQGFWIGHGDQPKDKLWSAEWVGQIDEVRISDVVRSAGWVQTQFENQYNPSSFYSVGVEETIGYSESASINLDTSAPAGVWHATARYSDSESDVIHRAGMFARSFIVKRGTSLNLIAPGDAIGDGISTKLVGEQLYVEFELEDTLNAAFVSGATVSMNWSVSGIPTEVQFNDYGNGRYGKTLNTSDLGSYGRWRLNLQTSHPFYTDASEFFYLDLSHRTFLTYDPPPDAPYGDDFEIRLTLKDQFDNAPLTGATIACNATILGTPTDYGNGTYLVTVDSAGFSIGEHTFRFTATPSTSYLLSSNIDVQFTYRPIATDAAPLSPDPVEAPWGQQANTSIYLYDVDHAGIGIEGASISITPFVQTQTFEAGSGYYSITIDVSSLTPGIYFFDLTCSKMNYQSSIVTISITILTHLTTPSVDYNSTIPVGTETYFDISWLDLDLDSVMIGGGNLSQVSIDWGTGSTSFAAFSFWLDTSGWAVGSYTINVTINAITSPRFYTDSYIIVQLEIRKLNVYLSWEPLEPFPNGNDFVLFVYVNVSEPSSPIDGTPIAGLDQTYFSARNETGGLYTFESFANLGNGLYQITIDSSRFLEGQYKIIIFVDFQPTENYIDTNSPQISFTYRPILTYLSSPNYPTVATSFDTNVTITLSYVDIDNSQNITIGAITSEGALIVWEHIGSGIYEVLIVVQGWDLGAHEVNLTADASGYQAKTLTFEILVQIAYAYARSSVSIIDLPVGDTAVFYADYWDITHDEPILGATISHNWIYPLSISWTGDQYRIELPSEDIDGLGSYLVIFNFSKGPNYQFGYFNISIILRTHLTEFRLASAIEPTSYNAMVNISVYCGDLDNDAGIIDAPVNLSVYGELGWILSTYENDTILGNGYYIIRFPATNLGPSGIFELTIYFNWTGPVQKYYDGSVKAFVKIIGEASELSLIDSAGPTPYLNNLTYTYLYSELYSGNGISNISAPAGNVFIYVEFIGYTFSPSLFTITEDSGNPGYYSIEFNSTMFEKPGIYAMIVYVNWSKGVDPGYDNRTDSVSVRIIPRNTLVNLIPPESTPYGVNATFSFSFDDVAESTTERIPLGSQMDITIGLPDYSITYNTTTKQFHVSFNTSILGSPLGSRQFTISVSWSGSPYYANVTGRIVIINVRFRDTEFDYSTISPTSYGDNVTLHVTYTDVTLGIPQTINDGTVTLFNGSLEIPVSEYSVIFLGNGEYDIELKTTYFSRPGTYSISVRMSTSHFYYAIVTATRSLNLRYRLTVLLVEPVTDTPYNNSLEVVFHYSDALSLVDIGNTSTPTTIRILNGSSWLFSSVWRGSTEDYLLTIQTYNQLLEINREYVLWIEISYPDSSPFYLSADAFASFTLRERATNLELTVSPEPTQYLENINFTAYYQDSLSLNGIAGASIALTVGGVDLLEGVDYILQSPTQGTYHISLNTTALGPAGTSVNLVFSASWTSNAPYYSTSTISLTLSVTQRESLTEILASTTLVKFLENVTFTIRYSDVMNGKAIQLSKGQLLIYSKGTLLQNSDFSMSYLSSSYVVSINSSVLNIGLVSNWNITFYIDWQESVAPYYSDGRASAWVTVVNRIGLIIRGATPTVPIHDNMTLEFTYVDDSTGAGINDAIVIFDCLSPSGLVEGVNFWIFRNAGDYSIVVDTTSLGSTGTFTFSLRLLWNPTMVPFYKNTTTIFLQGSVRLIQAQLTNEEPNPSTVPINDNVSVVLNLQDLDHSIPISGAETSFSVVYKTNESGPASWSITPISQGVYELVVDCFDAGVTGTNALIITLSLSDYQTIQIQVPFQIRLRQGELDEVISPDAFYGEATYVIVELVDTDANNTPISDAILIITWPDIGYTPDYTPLGNGQYMINLTTTSLDAGLFTLVVGAQKSDYFIADISVPVQILAIPTNLILPQTIPDVYWGDDIALWAIFNNTRDNILISGASLVYKFGVLSGSLSEVILDPGNYSFTVDTGNLAIATTYVVSITATLKNYVTITRQVIVNVLKLPIALILVSEAQQEVYKGSFVNITVYVNNTYSNTPLLGAIVKVSWFYVTLHEMILSPIPGKNGYYGGFIDTSSLPVSDYVVTIRAEGTNYLSVATSASIKVLQIKTILLLDDLTSTYSARTFNWSDTIRIGVYVLAPSLNESYPLSTGIANCIVRWSLSGSPFTGEFLNGSSIGGPGYFYFDFETWNYDASTYTLRITAYPIIAMFAYSNNLTTLIIEPIETSVESTYLGPKIWGWTGWVNLTYWDILFDRGIAGASVVVDWDGEESVFNYYANGTYQIFINTSLVSPGIYPVSVRFLMDNYRTGTGVFTLTVKEVPTSVAVFAPEMNQIDEDVLDLRVPYGDILPLVLFYNDTWYNRGISGATEMTGVILVPGDPEADNLLIEELAFGNYSLMIDTTRWQVSSIPYEVVLRFYLANWSRATIKLQITIINVPTDIQVDGLTSLTLSYGQYYSIWVFYYDDWIGHATVGITGGSINATSLDLRHVKVMFNQSDPSRPGWYEIRVRSQWTQGSTIISIILSKENYDSASIVINISVEPSDVDILIGNVIIYGFPIGVIVLAGALLWSRLFSVPKRLREIRGMVKTISKGKIPKPPENVLSRQEIVADLFNDIAGPIGITKTASSIPSEAITTAVPEIEELLVQLSILTKLTPEELEDFKFDVSKMKLSEQVNFVKEVINQEAIKQGRIERKPMELILEETAIKARAILAGEEIEEITAPKPVEEQIETEEVKEPERMIPEPVEFEEVISTDMLSDDELKEIRKRLTDAGIKGSELETIMDQTRELPRELAEELLKSILGKGGDDE